MHHGWPRLRATSPVPRHPGRLSVVSRTRASGIRMRGVRLRRALQCATFFVPGSLFVACTADPGDALKTLGEAPNPSAGATSTASGNGTQGAASSSNPRAGSSTGNATATQTSSSTGQTNADASQETAPADAGGAGTGSTGGGSTGSTDAGPTNDGGAPESGGPPSAQCSPTTTAVPTTWPTGGLALSPANYYSGLANGGYAYPYSDQSGDGGGTSEICQQSSALCAVGTTGIQSAATWGAGLGVNLDQMQGNADAVETYAVPSSATGISYALTALPASQTVYLTIDNGGTDYYATLTALSGHVPWSSFRTTPWTPATSTVLGTAPSTATHVEFQFQAESGSASELSFCVTSLSFQ